MAKFKFRLQTLLRLRDMARQQRREELADAYRVDATLQEQLHQLSNDLAELKRHQAVSPGKVNVDRLIEGQRYSTVLQVEIHNVRQQRAALAVEIQRRRETLVAADRDVRVLEKLRDKQYQRHLAEQQVQEVKLLDEVAANTRSREVV